MSYRERQARRRARFRRRIYALLGLLLAFCFLFAGAGVAVIGVFQGATHSLPEIKKVKASPAQTTKFYAADGTLLTNLFYEEDREIVPLKDVSLFMQKATIAIEDERFYQHKGYDPRGILRALKVNIGAGGTVEGGSTITQQLIKTLLGNKERTIGNKLQEAVLAYRWELLYKKDETLESYLNTIFFGQSYYGVETASLKYFGKRAKNLTLPESATLAGVIHSPNTYSPYTEPEAMKNRRDNVLKKMLALKMISEKEFLDAVSAPMVFLPPQTTTTIAPYFVEHVKQELLAKYGDKLVFKGGLRVYTTIDLAMQKKAEDAAWNILDQADDPAVSLVSVEPQTGYIKAMVGGRDFNKNKFNLATQGQRQPGSTFKTFVLAAALEKGMSPNKTYESSPINISVGGDTWQVRNYADGPGKGAMTLRSALIGSVNCVFARLIMDVGPTKVVSVAEKMGITSELQPYPAISLGGLETGVTSLEMASAYGTIANGGMYVTPTPFTKITDASGKLIEEYKPKPAKAIEPTTAAIMVDIMRDVINYGTGTAANIGRPAAGKTGTGEKYRDAWFVGFTPELSTSVWVGYQQGQIEMYGVHGISVTGGSFPARIWSRYMRAALEDVPASKFPSATKQGIDVSEIKVCAESGDLPAKYCTRKVARLFPKGGEPTDTCSHHNKPSEIPIPVVVGLSEQEAIDLLHSFAFKADVKKVVDPGTIKGQVVSQIPPGESLASQDTTVTIVVNSGP